MIRGAAVVLALFASPAVAADPGGALAFRAGVDTLAVPAMAARGVAATNPSGQPLIAITLADGMAVAFSRFTAAHVGETLEILICGAVASRPVLDAPIHGNEVRITGAFSEDEAADLARRISADDCAGFVSPFAG